MVPKSRRATGAASPRSSSMRHPRRHRRAAQRLHGPARASRTRVTRFDNVRVPAENVVGKEGMGLKIALTTLNTGRLALPAICASAGEVRAEDRARVGRTSGCSGASRSASTTRSRRRSPSIAGDDVRARGDARRVEPRSPTRSATTSASRRRSRSCTARRWRWQVVDEHDPGPRRPRLRDRRVARRRGARSPSPPSRCCGTCGSTASSRARREIMQLIIAREAVDQHLPVAGDIIEPDVPTADKAKTAGEGRRLLREVAAEARPSARALNPTSYAEFGAARRAPAVRRAQLPQARPLDLLRDEPLAGEAGEEAGLPRPHRRHRLPSCTRCRRVRATRRPDRARTTRRTPARHVELADLFCQQSRLRVDRLFDDLWFNDDAENYDAARKVLDGRYTAFEADLIDPAGEGPLLPHHVRR